MIHIGGNWYIDGDRFNITLYRKMIGKEGKNKGVESFKEVAYYRTIPDLLKGLTRHEIRLGAGQAKDMKDLIVHIDSIYNMIDEFARNFDTKIAQAESNIKNAKIVKEDEEE